MLRINLHGTAYEKNEDGESKPVSCLYQQGRNQCTNVFELHYRPSIKIPVSVMMPVAHVVEWTYQKFAKYGMKVPQLTPSRIRLLSCNRTFSCSRAKDQLGYEPLVSLKVPFLSISFNFISDLSDMMFFYTTLAPFASLKKQAETLF